MEAWEEHGKGVNIIVPDSLSELEPAETSDGTRFVTAQEEWGSYYYSRFRISRWFDADGNLIAPLTIPRCASAVYFNITVAYCELLLVCLSQTGRAYPHIEELYLLDTIAMQPHLLTELRRFFPNVLCASVDLDVVTELPLCHEILNENGTAAFGSLWHPHQ
jgi:hypothetical protein